MALQQRRVKENRAKGGGLFYCRPSRPDADNQSSTWRKRMSRINSGWLIACAVLVTAPLAISTLSVAQAPPPRPAPIMPPAIPPSHVVDLMSAAGATALGAQWKVSDVKIVEVPAIQGAMPQYKTTYNIEP